jgi:hypothetical protein
MRSKTGARIFLDILVLLGVGGAASAEIRKGVPSQNLSEQVARSKLSCAVPRNGLPGSLPRERAQRDLGRVLMSTKAPLGSCDVRPMQARGTRFRNAGKAAAVDLAFTKASLYSGDSCPEVCTVDSSCGDFCTTPDGAPVNCGSWGGPCGCYPVDYEIVGPVGDQCYEPQFGPGEWYWRHWIEAATYYAGGPGCAGAVTYGCFAQGTLEGPYSSYDECCSANYCWGGSCY